MKLGRCPDCKNIRLLNKHSLNGGHTEPFIFVCRKCHDKIHGMNPPKPKLNRKFAKGTKKRQRK